MPTKKFCLIDSSGDQCLIALLSEPVKSFKIKVLNRILTEKHFVLINAFF